MKGHEKGKIGNVDSFSYAVLRTVFLSTPTGWLIFGHPLIVPFAKANFIMIQVARSATGKMFNCCTIASWSLCLRSRRDNGNE